MEQKTEVKPATVAEAKPAAPAAPGLVLPEKPKPAKVEVNRELAALAAKAKEVDAAAGVGTGTVTGKPGQAAQGPVPASAAPPPLPDTVAEVRMILGMVKPAAEMLVPYLRGADQAAWDALAEPAAALCEHYGVSLGSWMQSPWARLAGAAVPLAMHGFMAWQADQAKKGTPAALPAAAAPAVAVTPPPEAKQAEAGPPPVSSGVNIALK